MSATQARAQVAVNEIPIHVDDRTGWRPPYAWDPTHTNYVPAIFTHPTFANRTTHAEAPMDPPLVREWMTAATNTTLHLKRAVP